MFVNLLKQAFYLGRTLASVVPKSPRRNVLLRSEREHRERGNDNLERDAMLTKWNFFGKIILVETTDACLKRKT